MATMRIGLHQILKIEKIIQDYLTNFHGPMEAIVLTVFEFDAQRAGQMKKYVHAESQALSELQAALAAGDQAESFRGLKRSRRTSPNCSCCSVISTA
ncbi:MAG: hypothetical protein ACE5HO_03815 [bacterium]